MFIIEMAMLVGLLALFLLQGEAHSQPFSFDFIDDSGNAPALQVDSTGTTYLATGKYLYRLNAQLVEQERVRLGGTMYREAFAQSAGTLVVCLRDLSCYVYNASNLSPGPIRSVSVGARNSVSGITIIPSGDTFYTGTAENRNRTVLEQFGEGFNRSSDYNPSGSLNELLIEDSRYFRRFYAYGGFLSGGYAYYVVLDKNPATALAVRLLRICKMPDCGGPSTCGVNALYELAFDCGFQKITIASFLCGVSFIEDFSGISGPTAIVNLCFGRRNSICVLNVTAADEAMDKKYDSCIVSRTFGEQIGLPWRSGSNNCGTIPRPQVCSILWCIVNISNINFPGSTGQM